MLRPSDVALIGAVLSLCPAGVVGAQGGGGGRDTEFHFGRWSAGDGAAIYELRTSAPLVGYLTHGFAATVVIDDQVGRRRAFYGFGWELQAFRPHSGLGGYGLAGVSVGLLTDTVSHHLGAHWSLGAGVEWRPFEFAAVGMEGRYRVADAGPRGFWAPGDARTGFSVGAGVTMRLGRRSGRRGPGGESPLPPPEVPEHVSGGAADVVHTALEAIGRPYQWGGTAENGFDCSGLIQYAYGRYGIRLPRMSRDQARAGSEVPPEVEALQPGDILLFAARAGGGVTHVGMYVGERKFIHSSSTGVRLSYLDVHDPEGGYWLPRWVGARRVIQ